MKSKSYRLGVGIMLLNEKNKVFVGKRKDIKSDAWQMPQGGVNKGEKDEVAAFRELYEETGIKKVKIISKSKKFYKYNIPISLKKKLWNGEYIGQKQKWFIMRFVGNEEEINIKTKNAEFKEWKWIDINQLINVVVSFKLNVYKSIVKELNILLN